MLAIAELPQTVAALRAFDDLPDSANVRAPVVDVLFSVSPDTRARRIKAGLIPAPHKFGPRTNLWNVGELRAALAAFRTEAA